MCLHMSTVTLHRISRKEVHLPPFLLQSTHCTFVCVAACVLTISQIAIDFAGLEQPLMKLSKFHSQDAKHSLCFAGKSSRFRIGRRSWSLKFRGPKVRNIICQTGNFLLFSDKDRNRKWKKEAAEKTTKRRKLAKTR